MLCLFAQLVPKSPAVDTMKHVLKSMRDGTAAVAASAWRPWSWCLSSGVQGIGALKPRLGGRAVEGHTCEGGPQAVAPQRGVRVGDEACGGYLPPLQTDLWRNL